MAFVVPCQLSVWMIGPPNFRSMPAMENNDKETSDFFPIWNCSAHLAHQTTKLIRKQTFLRDLNPSIACIHLIPQSHRVSFKSESFLTVTQWFYNVVEFIQLDEGSKIPQKHNSLVMWTVVTANVLTHILK